MARQNIITGTCYRKYVHLMATTKQRVKGRGQVANITFKNIPPSYNQSPHLLGFHYLPSEPSTGVKTLNS
jgi:hypothetical protein